MMDLTNKIFKQHFGPVKLTELMAAEIVADQERIDEEINLKKEVGNDRGTGKAGSKGDSCTCNNANG